MSNASTSEATPSTTPVPEPTYTIVFPATENLGLNLKGELTQLKERNVEDKRLKEKFPAISGEPTWLLHHIELLQEEYAKIGWEYEIKVPEECRHRIYHSTIGSYLIFLRDRKGRKGKVSKEYMTIPLSSGAAWGTWKPLDDDARPLVEGRLPYLLPLGANSPKAGYGLLDHQLDTYLASGEYSNEVNESTINGTSAVPKNRPGRPARRVVSNESSSSGSSGMASAYSGNSGSTAPTAHSRPSIMGFSGNYAPERATRSTRKVSNISKAFASRNSPQGSDEMPIPGYTPVTGSIRKPKNGERSVSEGLEDESEIEEECDNQKDDDESPGRGRTKNRHYGQKARSRVVRNSDPDDDEEEDEVGDEFAVRRPRRQGLLPQSYTAPVGGDEYTESSSSSSKKRSSSEVSEESDNETDSGQGGKFSKKFRKGNPDNVEEESGEEAGSGEGVGSRDDEVEGYLDPKFQDAVGVEDDYGEEVDDDEWFDESGYCNYCGLHQHECECIRGDENDPKERGEDDDEYGDDDE